MDTTSPPKQSITRASTPENGAGRPGRPAEGATDTGALILAGGQASEAGPGPSLCLGSPAREADEVAPWGGGADPRYSLVGTTDNSAISALPQSYGLVGTTAYICGPHLAHQAVLPERPAERQLTFCPDAKTILGVCEHGTKRWLMVPCERRDCEWCGPIGRYRIAQRLALGVRKFWPCAWLVLTLAEDQDKAGLVKRLGSFVKALRRRVPGLEYAATYELTRRGRLHINLIAGPWQFIDQAELQRLWGAIVSVEWVQDGQAVGKEAAKAYSPEALGGYLSKLEQAVPDGRRVSYSKGWPRLPFEGWPRLGQSITWRLADWDEEAIFRLELGQGHWKEIRPGEYAWRYGEECHCFEARAGPIEI